MPAAALIPLIARFAASRGATAAAGAAAAEGGAATAGAGRGLGSVVAELTEAEAASKILDRGLPKNGGKVPRGGGIDTNTLWGVTAALDLINRIDSQLPTFQHVIDVTVNGGPKSDLNRIWVLALATAFGRYRQAGLEGIQGASLEGWWDITEKIVRVRLQYVNSGAIEVAQSAGQSLGLGGLGIGRTNTTPNFLINGPTQETVGGNRASWLEAENVLASAATAGTATYIGGSLVKNIFDRTTFRQFEEESTTAVRSATAVVAISEGMVQAAKNAQARIDNPLPDAGRLITTTRKTNPNVQPPAPSGDGLSRTSPFIALVSNALTDPGYLPASPPQVKQTNKVPVFFAPSIWSQREAVNAVIANYNANLPVTKEEFGDTGDTVIVAADGYDQGIPGNVADLTGITNTGV